MNVDNIDDDDVLDGDPLDDDDVLEEDSPDEELAETVVLTEVDEDPIGDTTIEKNIEKLVAKLEDGDSEDVHRKAEIRRKLEEAQEQREKDLDSTFNFNMNED